MNENIIFILGKSRKTGKWEIICAPDVSYGEHLSIYRKFATAAPVSEEYSRILSGRIQSTSTALTLITGDENKKRIELQGQRAEQATNAGADAVQRQKDMEAEVWLKKEEAHETLIDKKNALVNGVRKATGQPVLPKTKTEQAADNLQVELSKPKPIIKPEPVKTQTQEEAIAEKNKLTSLVQEQAADNLKNKSTK